MHYSVMNDENLQTGNCYGIVRRQIDVERQNLVQICRLSVKSLVDKSCNDEITDECEELVNFIAVLEHVFMFQMKPHRIWYKPGESSHYWDYIRTTCKKACNHAIRNIESISDLRTNVSKGRAWIRLALMEKRLAEYLALAQANTAITKMFYEDNAIIGGEDGSILTGLFIGLNSIDFSFCLKGQPSDLVEPLVIDYAKYIDYPESGEEELDQDTNTNATVYSVEPSDAGDNGALVLKTKDLESKLHNATQQKDYLEELVRVRTTQLQNLATHNQKLLASFDEHQSEAERDTRLFENVIIELQQQLVDVKEHNRAQQMEIASLRSRLHTTSLSSDTQHDKMMQQIVTAEEFLGFTDSHSFANEASTQTTESVFAPETNEETFSLLPLTGSLTDLDAVSIDNNTKSAMTNLASKDESQDTSTASDLRKETNKYGQTQEIPMSVIFDEEMKTESNTETETKTESTRALSPDSDGGSNQSNGTFEVILPEDVNGTDVEGEVEVKEQSETGEGHHS